MDVSLEDAKVVLVERYRQDRSRLVKKQKHVELLRREIERYEREIEEIKERLHMEELARREFEKWKEAEGVERVALKEEWRMVKE